MGLAGAGALGGVGKGMADLGNTILQAAVADQRLQREDRKIAQNDEQLKINRMLADGKLFKTAAGQALGDGWDEIFAALNAPLPESKPSAPGQVALAPDPTAITQQSRLLPSDLVTSGPKALARANSWRS
ncbi:MAG: hypothetical protein KBE28_03310 [Nitrospira sp.]|mgnify:FL=1|jgi:hypothetical protein|nr:hypothetical protein [Nitrospira sp.]